MCDVLHNVIRSSFIYEQKQLRYVRFMKQSSWCLGLGCNDGRLLVWDLKSKRCKNEYVAATRDSSITCLEFNWNDSSCCCGYDNGDVIIYNLVTGQPSKPMKSKTNQAIRSLQYNHLRKSILGTASDYGTVTLWDVNAKSEIHSFNTSHVAPATGLCFSPVNDILLMSVGLDKNIVCYDVHSKKPVQTMSAESPLTCIDLMSDGMTLAVGTSRGKILMYDLRQSSIPFKTVSAHRTSVTGVAFQKISDGPQRQSSSSKSSTMKSKAVQIGSKVKVKQFYDSDDNSVQSAIREDVIEGGSVDFSPKRPSRRSLTAQIFSPVKGTSYTSKAILCIEATHFILCY
ncbi:NEDD1 (predicted) [Pycnogonum litorale]